MMTRAQSSAGTARPRSSRPPFLASIAGIDVASFPGAPAVEDFQRLTGLTPAQRLRGDRPLRPDRDCCLRFHPIAVELRPQPDDVLARAAAAVAVIVEEQGAVGVKGNPAFSHAGLMETLAQPFGVEGGIGALVRRANQRFHDVEIEEQVLRSR